MIYGVTDMALKDTREVIPCISLPALLTTWGRASPGVLVLPVFLTSRNPPVGATGKRQHIWLEFSDILFP